MFAGGVALYFVGLCFSQEPAYVRWGLVALVVSTMIVCLVAIEQYFGGLEDTRIFFNLDFNDNNVPPEYLIKIRGDRPFGTFVYSNSLAGFLLLVLPVMIAFLWRLRATSEAAVVWVAMVAGGGILL